jgi:hypothetical protein
MPIFIYSTLALVTIILIINSNDVCEECSSYTISGLHRYESLSARAALESIMPPRVLILTSDNRPLDYSASSAFIQASTIINYQYASARGYDYKYFLVKYRRKAGNSSKDTASCYNSVLDQERAGPWSKLQVLWYVYNQFGARYDWFLYLDSDAIVINQSLNLYNYMKHVSYIVSRDRGCHFLLHRNCDIAFMHNKPFTLNFPNSGIFLFRRADLLSNPFETIAGRLFQLWWHHNRSDKKFEHDYEQSSLWNIVYQHDFYKHIGLNDSNMILYAKSNRLQLRRYISMIDDFSFDFQNGTQFIEHIGSTRKTRLEYMNRALVRLSINTTVAQFLYKTVRNKHVIKLDTSWDRIPPPNLTDEIHDSLHFDRK